MDINTTTWSFPSASESGADAANQPRSKSVEVVEGSSTRKPTELQHGAETMMQTRSKSVEVKKESKKRKSLEPQRESEAVKRLKATDRDGGEAPKTQASLFGPQNASETVGQQAIDLRETPDKGGQRRDEAIKEQGRGISDHVSQDGQHQTQDSSTGGDVAQDAQQDEPMSQGQRNIPDETQDGNDDDVIVVAGKKQQQTTSGQSDAETRKQKRSQKQPAESSANGEDDEEEPEWVSKEEVQTLRNKANVMLEARKAKIQEKNIEITFLKGKIENIEDSRDEMKVELLRQEEEIKEMREKLKSAKSKASKYELSQIKEWRKKEDGDNMASLKNRYNAALQAKQTKHDREQQSMDQRLKDLKAEIAEERKSLQNQQKTMNAEHKQRMKEARPETNKLVKAKDEELKLCHDELLRQNRRCEGLKAEQTSRMEEIKRAKEERDTARNDAKAQLQHREQLETEKVDLQAHVMREREKSALFYKNKSELSQQVANKRMAIVDLNRVNEKLVTRNVALEKDVEEHKAEITLLKEANALQKVSSRRIVGLEEELEAYKAEIAMLKEGEIKTGAQQEASSARIVALEEELKAYKAEIEMLKEAASAKAQPTPPSPSAIPQASPVPAVDNSNSHTTTAPEVLPPTPEAATTSSTEEHKSVWHSLPPNPEVNFAPPPRKSTPLSNTENTNNQNLDSYDTAKEDAPPAQDATTSTISENLVAQSGLSNDATAITEASPPEAPSSSITKEATPPTTFPDTAVEEPAPSMAPFNAVSAVDESDKLVQQNEAFQHPEAQTLQADRDVAMNEDTAGAGEDQVV